jgi:hypothetical protein
VLWDHIVEPCEDVALDIEFLDHGLDDIVGVRSGILEISGEGHPAEGRVYLVLLDPALLNVTFHAALKLLLGLP